MKKVIFAVMFAVFFCTPVFAAQFDIDYFNGVKWGAKLPQKGFKRSAASDGDWKFYSRASDKSMIEGITVEELTYTSTHTDGRFTTAHFLFHGDSDYQRIRTFLQKTYGQSKTINDRMEQFGITQGGRFVRVTVQYSAGQGLINFACDPGRR